jgi:hypothetical protein
VNALFKIGDSLLGEIKRDLLRPHPFAYERVGFLACRTARLEPQGWLLLGARYYPIADADYLPDDSVGALIGSDAIRKALQIAYNEPLSMAHFHLHRHHGMTGFSPTDKRETAKMIPDFWKVRPNHPHAAVILSLDSLCGILWEPGSREQLPITDFTVVGAPMKFVRQGP